MLFFLPIQWIFAIQIINKIFIPINDGFEPILGQENIKGKTRFSFGCEFQKPTENDLVRKANILPHNVFLRPQKHLEPEL